MNIANKITLSRIILTFVFMIFLSFDGLWAKIISLVVFLCAALTDLIDGRIAQRRNMVTDFGKLMDPIADKILDVHHHHLPRDPDHLGAALCFEQRQGTFRQAQRKT